MVNAYSLISSEPGMTPEIFEKVENWRVTISRSRSWALRHRSSNRSGFSRETNRHSFRQNQRSGRCNKHDNSDSGWT